MRFRRKDRDDEAAGPDDATGSQDEPADLRPAGGSAPRVNGPWDTSEDHGVGEDSVDLGSLRIGPLDHLDIRLQMDEQSGEVGAVMLADDEGAIELRAFAAPRSGGLWEEIRPGIVSEVERLGGQCQPFDGDLGVELRTVLPLTAPDGQQVVQPSRVLAFEGPRWLLRGTLLGRPAVETETADRWLDALAQVVVVRGDGAMPPGEPLGFTLPPKAVAQMGEDEGEDTDGEGVTEDGEE